MKRKRFCALVLILCITLNLFPQTTIFASDVNYADEIDYIIDELSNDDSINDPEYNNEYEEDFEGANQQETEFQSISDDTPIIAQDFADGVNSDQYSNDDAEIVFEDIPIEEETPTEYEPELGSDDPGLIQELLLAATEIPEVEYSEENANASVLRYVTLILDTSGSMSGSPASVQKEAAIKFCESLFNANGTNYISIIFLNSISSLACPFTNDIEVVKNCINSARASGGTNTNDALLLAKDLMEKVQGVYPNAIKNVVLCSDGLPENGTSSYDGPYYSSDISGYYGYANSAYSASQTIKEFKCNLYTLGFYHSLTGDKLDFGRRFMSDLSSGQGYYYEVTDVDQLEFSFGDIADDIVDEHRNPIVVIPGIMGSSLYNSNTEFNGHTKIWDPSFVDIFGLNKDLDINNTLYVRPCENQNIDLNKENDKSTVDDFGREYGALDSYQDIVDELCKQFTYTDPEKYRPVYVFSYDWRKSNKESAKSLKAAIQNILLENNCKKVDLVCHSMGGLVASNYIASNLTDNNVDRVITCGTPYEGAPKLINAVMNWDVLTKGFWDIPHNLIDFVLGLLGGMHKDLKASFSGVVELTPTSNYVDKIHMKKDSDKGQVDLSISDYQSICKQIFDEARYNDAVNFQESLHVNGEEFNVLLNNADSYFVVGIDHKTITSIKFNKDGDDVSDKLYESDLEYSTKGDGTVPYFSASICEKLEDLSSDRFKKYDVDHGETISDEECLKYIVSVLNNNPSQAPQSDEFSKRAFTVIRIACPVDVRLEMNGEVLSSISNNISTSASFGRLDVLGKNDEIKMLCIDSGEGEITLNGTDTGSMDYEIRFFDGSENLVEKRTFTDIPVTKDTVISTNTDYNNETVLEVDSNGDNVTDFEVRPDGTEEFVVTAEAGIGGTITPNGDSTVQKGGNLTFTITPDTGYVISDVLVDDNSVGAVSEYKFENVQTNHTIRAEFKTESTSCDHHDTSILNSYPASCTENGYTGDLVCNICGEILEKGSVIPAYGHNWGPWTITKPATLSETGLQQRTCSICGTTETEIIPQLNSVPSETPAPDQTSVTECEISLSADSLVYTGEALTPEVKVTYKEETLTEGTDYTLTCTNNTQPGEAVITITGMGKYSGTVTKTFKIVPVTPAVEDAAPAGTHSIKVTWSAAPGAKTYRLYYKGGGLKKWKLIKEDITGTSFVHTDSSLIPGTRYRYTVRAVNGDTMSGFDRKGKVARPVPAAPNLKKAVSVKKGVKLTWSANDEATGYIIQRRTSDGKWTRIKTLKSSGTLSAIDKKAGTGTSEYKVRAYWKGTGKTVYGKWSKVLSVTR